MRLQRLLLLKVCAGGYIRSAAQASELLGNMFAHESDLCSDYFLQRLLVANDFLGLLLYKRRSQFLSKNSKTMIKMSYVVFNLL